jgi:hypothetical protein
MKRRNKKKYFGSPIAFSITLAVVVCFSMIFDFKNKAEAAPDSVVYLNPAETSVDTGSAFSLDAMINPGTNRVSAVELHITFDHTKLNIGSITPNTLAFPEILTAAQIDNNAGTALIVLGSGSSAYVTTTSAIATINFTAVASGTDNVSLSGTRAAASGEGSTNVITSLTGSAVTVSDVVITYGNDDFALLVADWLQTKVSLADVNSDGTVNSRDLGIMMSNWEQ